MINCRPDSIRSAFRDAGGHHPTFASDSALALQTGFTPDFQDFPGVEEFPEKFPAPLRPGPQLGPILIQDKSRVDTSGVLSQGCDVGWYTQPTSRVFCFLPLLRHNKPLLRGSIETDQSRSPVTGEWSHTENGHELVNSYYEHVSTPLATR
jgi:hypothetical protein